MLRSLAVRLRDVLSTRFPPPTAFEFQLVAGAGQHHLCDNEEEDDRPLPGIDDEEDSHILMAGPKRRVTSRRKRIKYFQKHLTPLQGFIHCPDCGQQHPHYYQLCPFCKPFNGYIRSKDVPARPIDRLRRTLEQKLLRDMVKAEKRRQERKDEPATTKNATDTSTNPSEKR